MLKLTRLIRGRAGAYLLLGMVLSLGYVALRGTPWQGSSSLHSAMEAIATILALLVGVMALVHYYAKKDDVFLFVGAGFLGTASLDGYHAIVTSVAFKPFMPSDLPALIPWSWVASRQFLSVFILLGLLAWWRKQLMGNAGSISEKSVYLFAGIFTLASFLFFAFAPLPQAYYPEFFFHRPEEFGPAVCFLAALAGYLYKGYWQRYQFEHWLVISLIVGLLGQAVFMSLSGQIFDLEFDIAHLLKIVSYGCVLTGLLANMSLIFYQQSERTQAILQAKAKVEASLSEVDFYKQVLDDHAIVAMTDTAGTITFANSKFCEISKYDMDELIGANHRILNSGHHSKSFFKDMYAIISKGYTWYGEIKNQAKDGSYYWVYTTIKPLKNRNGKVVQYVAVRNDITQQKQGEEEARKLSQVLLEQNARQEELLEVLKQKSDEAQAAAEDLCKAKDAQAQSHEHLLSTIDSLRNGFVIWDENDTLVLANEAYRTIHSPIRDIIVKGVAFEDVMLAGFDAGIWNVESEDRSNWCEVQLASLRDGEERERELDYANGRQIIFARKVLENGSVIGSFVDISAHRARERELEETKQKLEQIAYFDNLTGLANRVQCKIDLKGKFADTELYKRFAIIQIDLDNFKRVNDTLGHAAGDHLLASLGERLEFFATEITNFKSYRWGGDEFLAIVDRDEGTDLGAICEELTDLIAVPLSYNGVELRPTVSLGIACYPEDACDIEALMIFSDLALYKTKELGRDGYQFFTNEMKEKIDAESKVENELRIAIADGQLELHYQPQVDVQNGTISGLEALLRWNHPTRGVLSPGEFLAVVEETGMASAFGREIFDQAMKAIAFWRNEGLEFGRLAINLSPEHLRKNTLIDDLFAAMERHNVGADMLAVEFLESLLLDDPNANFRSSLDQLRARGIHVELDDFGTGYASLSHLSSMPINGLKIDRSFICDVADNLKQQGIVTALLSMAELLDLRVVCEGIETARQLEIVANIGHCSVQGYFIAKPMDFESMTGWIRNEDNIDALKVLSHSQAQTG